MYRLAPLLLLAAPALCWAADTDDDPAPKRGACVYVRPAAADVTGHDAPQARPAASAVTRGAPKAARGNGGDAESTLTPRARAPHWHSFLPGMFR